MEKINTREELIESLKDVLAIEIGARDRYEEDVMTFRNFEIKDTMAEIKAEEDEHIVIIQNLINTLKKKKY
jgi:rubrerythrin